MVLKNQLLTLDCLRLGTELEGICQAGGRTVFVPGALPGERIEARVLKERSRYAFAKVERLLVASPDRQAPFCPVYGLCGGCSGQHMRYDATLQAKRRNVLDALRRVGGLAVAEEDVPPALGAENPLHGRNKTALPVGGGGSEPALGFYRKRSHQIVPIEDCPIAMPGVSGVITAMRDWMDRDLAAFSHGGESACERGPGPLRHVVVRSSRNGERMVLLVAATPRLPGIPRLIGLLAKKVPGFQSLHLSVNPHPGNAILGPDSQKLHGLDALTETLLGIEFEISPLAFLQVNPAQTEKLYQCVMDFADVGSGDIVVDAYSGAGTIALCTARRAGRVIGLEIVPQAVESARRNAERNRIRNVAFHAAAVEDALPRLVARGLRPDVVVLDPPRKGADPAAIEAVLAARPGRVVYVSCHPATQARDMALLVKGGYRLARCQPIDMFCYASGVENVCLLTP
ncbi:MAG: 23S rRNA (uracil(1939)-C(5))-methyltransferase RlmD [Clostridia bacterium]|nr:23S rRNA (uracil(1939)-C(5))-methyltransferase RlmD [Clostridia bacterium]